MPLQNRVTPLGEIIATPERGTLTGNRGVIHNADRQIVRTYQTRRWIFCKLQFKDRHRDVMTPRRWTELFFLDEAAALAAGHRPCAECSRERFTVFRDAWAKANPALAGSSRPLVEVIDRALHAERIDRARCKVTYRAALDNLPDGAFVLLNDDAPYVVCGRLLLRWTPGGYTDRIARPTAIAVPVLTPRSVVAALTAGFTPILHDSGLTAVS